MPIIRFEGDYGEMIFSGSSTDQGELTGRYLSLNTEAALNFFRKITLVKPDLQSNFFRLFSFARPGRHDKVRFASLTTPRHLLQSRKLGCAWNPKGEITSNIQEFNIYPIEYNGEQCPDVFYGQCLEAILGVGNQVRDLQATPEGRAMVGEMINRIYTGLGNDLYDLAWWGQHPLIDTADTNGWYTANEADWVNFKDQQDAIGGIMTMVDYLKHTEGLPQFNVQINESDVNGSEYVGTATDLFDRLIAAQKPEFKLMVKSGRIQGLTPLMLVSRSIFDKYEAELMSEWNQIPELFYRYYSGDWCAINGCSPNEPIPDVLKYKGTTVIAMDEWDLIDTYLGVTTHRAMLTVPGNFAIGFDVPSLAQFNGQGMRITQRLMPPYQGKIYMDTTFKVGTGIIDPDFMGNASLVLTP